ncbi:MAG: prepilin-type N-terminal cleavage/methylation domain-containing protein [Candidatus Taylorbacteria bacterium]|nr:prepilin-type N-terminal cleavage/methylation domain-containing protein [Candidatus Taylorbacteria bacterium]
MINNNLKSGKGKKVGGVERVRGFTLLETLVAIAILMVAITGPIVAAQKSLTSSTLARDQFTAGYLAQDAIEYIKSLKTYNIQKGIAWLSGMDPATCSVMGCYVDTTYNDFSGVIPPTPGLKACSQTECNDHELLYDSPNLTFRPKVTGTYDTGISTSFYRTVKISTVNPDEVRIEAMVKFKAGRSDDSITLYDNLYNF